jgi:hypothetical protein
MMLLMVWLVLGVDGDFVSPVLYPQNRLLGFTLARNLVYWPVELRSSIKPWAPSGAGCLCRGFPNPRPSECPCYSCDGLGLFGLHNDVFFFSSR